MRTMETGSDTWDCERSRPRRSNSHHPATASRRQRGSGEPSSLRRRRSRWRPKPAWSGTSGSSAPRTLVAWAGGNDGRQVLHL